MKTADQRAAGFSCFMILLVVVAAATWVRAKESGPSVSFDLDSAAMMSDAVRTEQISDDSIWLIEAGVRKYLVQVPLIIGPARESVDVKMSDLRLRGGRFLAFRFDDREPDEDPEQDGRRSRRRSRARRPRRSPAGRPGAPGPNLSPQLRSDRHSTRQRFVNPLMSSGQFGIPPGPDSGSNRPRNTSFFGSESTDEGADTKLELPQMARQFTVTPQGTIKWKLDRIPNATVLSSDNPYALRLDPDLLVARYKPDAAMRPQVKQRSRSSRRNRDRAPRSGRGRNRNPGVASDPFGPGLPGGVSPRRGSRRDSGRRVKSGPERTADRREQKKAYREIKKQIAKLPTDFEARVPRRVWAIYEVRSAETNLDLAGASDDSWSIPFTDVEMLVNLGAGSGSKSSDYDLTAIQGLVGRDTHVFTHRLVAHALNRAQMGQAAQPGDDIYRIYTTILGGSDHEARRVVVEDLVSTSPLTPTAYILLKQAKDLDPASKVLVLRGLLQADMSNPVQFQEMLGLANRLLAEPGGPPAGRVLAELVQFSESQPEPGMLLVGAVQFEQIPNSRRDSAITFIVEGAGDSPLVAAWLDQHLIGSTDPDLVHRTLEIIVDAGPVAMGPVVSAMLDVVLGPPSAMEDVQTTYATIEQSLPINSLQHSMLRVVRHSDAQLRRLAWQSLPRFTLGGDATIGQRRAGRGSRRGRGRGRTTTVIHEDDAYSLLVDAGISQTPSPSELVRFLLAQSDQQRVVAGLVRILLDGDDRIAAAAGRGLMGSGPSLVSVLNGFAASERQKFALRLYEVTSGRDPLVTPLMAHPPDRNRVVEWFGQEVADGRLPDASQWVDGYGGNETLVELIVSDDKPLVLAAVTALVMEAGGDEAKARALAEKMEDVSGGPIGAQTAWSAARQEIYLDKIGEAAGPYRMNIRVYGKPAPVTDEPNSGRRSKRSRSRRRSRRAPAAPPPGGIPGGVPGMGPGGIPGAFGPGMPGMPGGGFSPQGISPRRGRGRRGQPSSEIDLPTGPPDLVIDLGVVTLEMVDQKIKFANDAVAVSVSPEKLALRIDKPGELKNLPSEELAQLPFEMLEGPIDLVHRTNKSWLAKVILADTRTVVLVLEPTADL